MPLSLISRWFQLRNQNLQDSSVITTTTSSSDVECIVESVADDETNTVSTTEKWECSKCKNNNSSSLEICISCQTNKNSNTTVTIINNNNNAKSSAPSGFDNSSKEPVCESSKLNNPQTNLMMLSSTINTLSSSSPSHVFKFGDTNTVRFGSGATSTPSVTQTQPIGCSSKQAPLFEFSNTTSASAPSTVFIFGPKFGPTTPGTSPFNASPRAPIADFGAPTSQQAVDFGTTPTPAPKFNFGSQPAQQPQTPTTPGLVNGSKHEHGDSTVGLQNSVPSVPTGECSSLSQLSAPNSPTSMTRSRGKKTTSFDRKKEIQPTLALANNNKYKACGNNVSCHLEDVDCHQHVLAAKKLISNLLFYGKLGGKASSNILIEQQEQSQSSWQTNCDSFYPQNLYKCNYFPLHQNPTFRFHTFSILSSAHAQTNFESTGNNSATSHQNQLYLAQAILKHIRDELGSSFFLDKATQMDMDLFSSLCSLVALFCNSTPLK